jgi:hypothetical protein
MTADFGVSVEDLREGGGIMSRLATWVSRGGADGNRSKSPIRSFEWRSGRTNSERRAMYLSVALTRALWGGYQAEAWDILPFYSVRVAANSEVSYADAIAQLHRGLAYMGLWGEMDFGNVPIMTDPAEVDAVVDALTDKEKTITPEDTWRVRREVAEEEKRVGGGLEKLLEFMAAQTADEEEKDSITVGEALRRYKEGKERMRRIVEGEEPGADPKGSKAVYPARSGVLKRRRAKRADGLQPL